MGKRGLNYTIQIRLILEGMVIQMFELKKDFILLFAYKRKIIKIIPSANYIMSKYSILTQNS